jgi:DNA-binding MarR family transcriptional regulator
LLKFYTSETYGVRDSIGYLVRRASSLLTGHVEDAFAEHDITFAQWLVMMYLRDGLATTAAEIARGMCHDSGALTRVVDQLAGRGLIERHRSIEDRRIVELKLTDAGIATVNGLVPTVVGLLNAALSDFTTEEAATLTRLLTKLVNHVSAYPGADAEQPESVI